MMRFLLKSRFIRLRGKFYIFGVMSLGAFIGLASAHSSETSVAAVPSSSSLADKITPQPYMCYDHNVFVPVTYIETGGGNAYAVMQVEGKQITMARHAVNQNPAIADEKLEKPKYYYVSLDEQNSYRWYPEGDKAKLTFLAADDSAKEVPVYNVCRAEPYK